MPKTKKAVSNGAVNWQEVRLAVQQHDILVQMFKELDSFFNEAVTILSSGSPDLGYLYRGCVEWQERVREPSEAECALRLLRMGFEIAAPGGNRATEKELLKVIAEEKAERERKQ